MTRETSIEALHTIKENGLLSRRRLEVYEILFNFGPLTAHEVVAIARKQYPLSNQTSFNARLSELETMTVVKRMGTKTNPSSGVENYLWDVTRNLPIKLNRIYPKKCKVCNGTGEITSSESDHSPQDGQISLPI